MLVVLQFQRRDHRTRRMGHVTGWPAQSRADLQDRCRGPDTSQPDSFIDRGGTVIVHLVECHQFLNSQRIFSGFTELTQLVVHTLDVMVELHGPDVSLHPVPVFLHRGAFNVAIGHPCALSRYLTT